MNILVFLTRFDLFGCELQLGLCAISIMFPKKSLQFKKIRCFVEGLQSKKDGYFKLLGTFFVSGGSFLLQEVPQNKIPIPYNIFFAGTSSTSAAKEEAPAAE